ncbi:MAG: protein kinase [Acidobacteria bacterium]|nr:protein kinase [Acidobacteriota bacterium]
MTLSPGALFGRYVVQRLLGEGGMGEVYLAEDPSLGRKVALKVLAPGLGLSPKERDRLRREARAASALNHPGILTIYDAGEEDGVPYIASEYVEGFTLRTLLHQGPLPLRRAVDVAVQAAAALGAASRTGLVHRDVKPENLMLRPDGLVKVLDFGLAQPGDEAGAMDRTNPRGLLGTLRYMSPEQARGEDVDTRSDVFSLAVVLYEMVAGKAPFQGRGTTETLVAILSEDPVPVSRAAGQELPPLLERILEKALAKSRRKRFPTPDALHTELRKLARELETQAGEDEPPLHLEDSSDGRDTEPTREMVVSPLAQGVHNLPASVTSFVARPSEGAVVESLLRRDGVRLLTLTGPGGTGKTRLALQAAENLLAEFPGGVYFVPLAALSSADMVVPALAQALSLKESATTSAGAAVRDHLRRRRALIVFDNMEHLVAAASEVAALLADAPGVKVLVTSREALRVAGEHEYPVPPLAVPDPDRLPAVEDLGRFSSVALFLARAQAVNPGFRLDRTNAMAVARICARLEGLPLALELAAAKLRVLSPEEVLSRLDSRLRLLTGGGRDLPLRQQTMRGALEWGYNLLAPSDQALFSRLSVFASGFGIASAAAMLGENEDDILDGVTSLADKSLLVKSRGASGEMRFAMLETVREFGLEKLAGSGQEKRVRQAHAAHFRTLAEGARESLAGEDQPAWLSRLEDERGNLRSAIAFSASENDAETALSLVASLFWFWYLRGHYREGRTLLDRVLARFPDAPEATRLPALLSSGSLAFLTCDYGRAEMLLAEAAELARALSDKTALASALRYLGSLSRERGDVERALALHEESGTLSEEQGDVRGAARARNLWAFASWIAGHFPAAEAASMDTLQAFRKLGDREGITWSLLNLAACALLSGDAQRGAGLAAEALSNAEEAGYREGDAWAKELLGRTALARRDVRRAGEQLAQSLETHFSLGDLWRTASALEALAQARLLGGRPRDAAKLLGVARNVRTTIGAPVPLVERESFEATTSALREELGGPTFEALVTSGGSQPTARGIAEALELASTSTS